jgi:hypothetical protein
MRESGLSLGSSAVSPQSQGAIFGSFPTLYQFVVLSPFARRSALYVLAALTGFTTPVFGQNDYLPSFRGAIDVTGHKLALVVTALDPPTGPN